LEQDTDSRTEPVPKARAAIHRVILEWFQDKPRGRVLDAPAGLGHLGMHLQRMGFAVVSGEIEPAIFQARGLACVYTDLNREIRSPDGDFDYVCCVDGLEHMTDPYTAVAEFARVLKPGGIGVFSIPNYSNIEKRFKFFWKGYLTKPKRLEDFRAGGANLFNFHNSPLTITLLDLMFAINGLEIAAILRDQFKVKQVLWRPLVLIMKLAAACASAESRRRHASDLTLRDEVILGGNTLIFITRKTAGTAGGQTD
jgi:SAM-dependent methyltransferase